MPEWILYAMGLPVSAVIGWLGYQWGRDRGREEHVDECWIAHRQERDWREREGWTV